jgi:hypothetical protein
LKMGKSKYEPIGIHPENSHYMVYHGDPVILITSAEHYGAVVNGRFDYGRYLRTLDAYGLNYTRIYPGSLIEYEGKIIENNTLGVKSNDLILPWERSASPGYVQGGNLFDMDLWSDAYFMRLKDFIAKAAECGIIVEICFFNACGEDTWAISPLNCQNNIQGSGRCDFLGAQTLHDTGLVSRQEAYIRKIVDEINPFDNVILEICDEPTISGTPVAEALDWVRYMAGVIEDAESRLPKKHLVAQQVEGRIDLSDDTRIDIVTAQYVWEAFGEQMGGMQALDSKYGQNKPIELNETFYFPDWYYGDIIAASRVEAWEFIVGGGAAFNHLNGCFTVENPEGNVYENNKLLTSLKSLKEFMDSFDFIAMYQDKDFIKKVPGGVFCRGISQPGRQYALYLHHSKYLPSRNDDKAAYVVTPGRYLDKLTLDIPAGRYQLEWVDPSGGKTICTEDIVHDGNERIFKTPVYEVDIALRIKSVSEATH